MGWKSNQVQRLSVGLLTLFIASLDASQNSVNQSIKKHQSTFENVAMDIWDLAEVGYQEYKSAEILINVLKKNGFKIYTWTVNNKEDISFMQKLNVDGVISDYPDQIWY